MVKLTLESWITFQDEELKGFLLDYFKPEALAGILDKVGISLPTELVNFTGNQFETKKGEKVTLNKEQHMIVEIGQSKEIYAIEDGSEVVLICKGKND